MIINVLGYGIMAKQIGALFYLGGHNVVFWNHKAIALEEMNKQVKLLKRFFEQTKEGEFSVALTLNELDNHLTIESVVEEISVKRALYNALREKITRGYFTNTS